MTETSISLLSILSGISGAILTGVFFKRFSLRLTGNTIAGVFGSILFLKSIAEIGVDPSSIVETGTVNITLLFANGMLSLISGSLTLILVSKTLKTISGE